ncbi:hypothetical protein [Streptomyces sp. NPDC096934]|uniref:hypothetical protein n=1 Tax=Streptomyces sp. NPDC096934 TaxID=3155551 RepID=UPI00331A239D
MDLDTMLTRYADALQEHAIQRPYRDLFVPNAVDCLSAQTNCIGSLGVDHGHFP